MKKLIVICFMFLAAFSVSAQTKINPARLLQGTTGGGSMFLRTDNSGNVSFSNNLNGGVISGAGNAVLGGDLVNFGQLTWANVTGRPEFIGTISILSSYSGIATTAFVAGKSGGIFDWSTSGTADGGKIITSTGKGGVWIRRTYDSRFFAEWYGAIADDDTDDSGAFQAMFDSPHLSNRVNIATMGGTFNMNNRAVLSDKESIYADFNNAKIKVGTNNAAVFLNCAFYFGRGGTYPIDKENIIKNVTFDFQSNTSSTQTGLYLANLKGITTIENCNFVNVGSNNQTGLYLFGVGDSHEFGGFGWSPGITISKCNFRNEVALSSSLNYNNSKVVGNGIVITGNQTGDYATSTVTEFGKISDCTAWGISKFTQHIEGANWTYSNCNASFCNPNPQNASGGVHNQAGVIGVYNTSTSNNGKITIANSQFKHNEGYVIYNNYNSQRPLVISNNQFVSNNYTSIYIENSGFNTIIGNLFDRWNQWSAYSINAPFSDTRETTPAVRMLNSSNNIITNNQIFGDSGNAFEVKNGTKNNISNNKITGCNIGFQLETTNQNLILNNDFTSCAMNINEVGCTDNLIKNIIDESRKIDFFLTVSYSIPKLVKDVMIFNVSSATGTSANITLPADAVTGDSYTIRFSGVADSLNVNLSTPNVITTGLNFLTQNSEYILKSDHDGRAFYGDVMTFVKINPKTWYKISQNRDPRISTTARKDSVNAFTNFNSFAGKTQFGIFASQFSNSAISARAGGLEFGHPNAAGFGSTLGNYSQFSYLGFNAENGTTAGTIKTTGIKSAILRSDNAGGFVFARTTNANADNQTPVTTFTIDSAGLVNFLPANVYVADAIVGFNPVNRQFGDARYRLQSDTASFAFRNRVNTYTQLNVFSAKVQLGAWASQFPSTNISARAGGIEFGHPNSAGFGSTIGNYGGTAFPFIAFNGELGTTSGTIRTRGINAAILRSDNAGGFVFETTSNVNADNQTPNVRLTIANDGTINTQNANILTGNAIVGLHAVNRQTGDARYLAIAATATNSNALRGLDTNVIALRNAINAFTENATFAKRVGIGGAADANYALNVTGSGNFTGLNVQNSLITNALNITGAALNTTNTEVLSINAGVVSRQNVKDLEVANYQAITLAPQTIDIGGGVLKHVLTLDCQNFYKKSFRVNMTNNSATAGTQISFINMKSGGDYTVTYFNNSVRDILYDSSAKLEDGSTNFSVISQAGAFTHRFTGISSSAVMKAY